ncbi:MAG: hypothetical protein ACTSXF_15210 [Promethearchaeota archaeon]
MKDKKQYEVVQPGEEIVSIGVDPGSRKAVSISPASITNEHIPYYYEQFNDEVESSKNDEVESSSSSRSKWWYLSIYNMKTLSDLDGSRTEGSSTHSDGSDFSIDEENMQELLKEAAFEYNLNSEFQAISEKRDKIYEHKRRDIIKNYKVLNEMVRFFSRASASSSSEGVKIPKKLRRLYYRLVTEILFLKRKEKVLNDAMVKLVYGQMYNYILTKRGGVAAGPYSGDSSEQTEVKSSTSPEKKVVVKWENNKSYTPRRGDFSKSLNRTLSNWLRGQIPKAFYHRLIPDRKVFFKEIPAAYTSKRCSLCGSYGKAGYIVYDTGGFKFVEAPGGNIYKCSNEECFLHKSLMSLIGLLNKEVSSKASIPITTSTAKVDSDSATTTNKGPNSPPTTLKEVLLYTDPSTKSTIINRRYRLKYQNYLNINSILGDILGALTKDEENNKSPFKEVNESDLKQIFGYLYLLDRDENAARNMSRTTYKIQWQYYRLIHLSRELHQLYSNLLDNKDYKIKKKDLRYSLRYLVSPELLNLEEVSLGLSKRESRKKEPQPLGESEQAPEESIENTLKAFIGTECKLNEYYKEIISETVSEVYKSRWKLEQEYFVENLRSIYFKLTRYKKGQWGLTKLEKVVLENPAESIWSIYLGARMGGGGGSK